MVGFIAIAITALIVAGVAWTVDDWKRDWTTNHAEWGDIEDDPEKRPVRVSQSPDEVVATIEAWVETQPSWAIESKELSSEPKVMHLTRRTRWMRFVDDIHVRLSVETTDDGSVVTRVDAESQSRVGKGDLGQNPRNLTMLRDGLE